MGGKAFPDTVPIPIYLKDRLEIDAMIGSAIGYRSWCFVGSSARLKDYYNDIDVAILLCDSDWILFQSNLKDMGYSIKKITPHCISVAIINKFSSGTERYQIDFMQSRDLQFSINAYWSSAKTLYKGAHRNILLTALLNVLSTKEWKYDDVMIRTKEHIDQFEGLMYLVQKKSKKSKRYDTIDKRVISLLPFEQMIQLFFPEIHWYELDSFETVYQALMKKYYSKEDNAENIMMYKIMIEAASIFKTTHLEMPHEIKCWVELG